MPYTPFQCIFCKATTVSFTSNEHIVPESLGNTEHILPPGVVCDGCNNYFARKIEGPILGSDLLMQARHRNGIPSKRKRVPFQSMLSFPDALPLEMGIARDGSWYLSAADESDNDQFIKHLLNFDRLTAVFPVAEKPERRLFSRFLLVMGIEYLAHRMLSVNDGILTDHINNSALDEARRYSRFNEGGVDWPFHECQIYPEGKWFLDEETGLPYDIPHEFTLLYTPQQEMYFVIAIFGIQYTINLGGPEIEGFCDWLVANDNASPLYLTGT
ncbi:MAG TPA: HNH endonuclease [Blastocatellia bacterium]|nr:HNH endonuclease [Blastocatellia bacterium]